MLQAADGEVQIIFENHGADGHECMSIDNCSACLHSIDHNGALIPPNESEVRELQVVESAQAIPERHHFGGGNCRRTANTPYNAFWSH